MNIISTYSFNNGENILNKNYKTELNEIYNVINNVNAELYKTKKSKEKTMKGKILYSPKELNSAFKQEFNLLGWHSKKEYCNYQYPNLKEGYIPIKPKNAFREMDFLKNEVGVEVQFGKYSFMVYNVCAKMTIFKNLGHIKVGVEIVPMHNFAPEMSTGVSFFDQIIWDLDNRGISNIDTPVLIIGIDK